jgi:hypothetical protein
LAGEGNISGGMRFIFQGRERSVVNGRVGRGNGVQMKVGWQFPGDIVVGFAFVPGKHLRRKQIDGVIAIRLIETDDIGAGREVALFETDGVLRAGDFDALREQAAHHIGNAFAISLIFR